LDEKYPKEERNKVTKIANDELEGFLNLSDFVNLTELDISNSSLTKLNLTSCVNL